MTEGILQVQYASQDIFMMVVDTKASMTSNLIDFSPAGVGVVSGFPFRVVGAKCIMTGAGGAGDTIKLQKAAGATPTVTDISDAVDVSAKADKTVYEFGTFDTAQCDLNNGDKLRLLTASDALSRVLLTCIKLQATP